MMSNQFNRREFFAKTAMSGIGAALTTAATVKAPILPALSLSKGLSSNVFVGDLL